MIQSLLSVSMALQLSRNIFSHYFVNIVSMVFQLSDIFWFLSLRDYWNSQSVLGRVYLAFLWYTASPENLFIDFF